MSVAAEPGWYHCPGDSEGTVRLWNGTNWVGFPQRPQSSEGRTVARPQRSGPFPGQRRLIGYSVLAAVGLVVMAYICSQLMRELLALRDDLQAFAGSGRQIHLGNSPVSGPFGNALVKYSLVFIAAGLPFLIWEWRAYRNVPIRWTPTASRFPQMRNVKLVSGAVVLASVGVGLYWGYIVGVIYFFRLSFATAVFFLTWFIRKWIYRHTIAWVTGPMGTIGEHSPDLPKNVRSPINPFLVGLWWILWLGSVFFALVFFGLARSTPIGNTDELERWINGGAIALGAHIGSLAAALILVLQVTKHQDGRFRNA